MILRRKNKKKKAKKAEEKPENKLAEYIKENIDFINESVTIVFVENDADKNNLYKAIDENGCVCNFEKQKPYDIAKRLKGICNAYKVNVDGATLNYLIENCGTSLQDLINEIRKQIEYVGENGTITKQTIDLLAIKQFESIIFDLTDSLGRKNIAEALQVLKNLLYAKEPIQKIFITLYNHFKKLYITKVALREKIKCSRKFKTKTKSNIFSKQVLYTGKIL